MSGLCLWASLEASLVPAEAPIDPLHWKRVGALVCQRGERLFSWRSHGCWCWQALESEACPRSWERCLSPWVAADARLYYRTTLLEALRAHEAVPAALTDLEYLAWSYRCWGEECLRRLEGDYACVFWDEAHQTVLAARSPFGWRPLFYRLQADGQALVLASDPAWLLVATGDPGDLDPDWVCWYLATGQFLRGSPWRMVQEVPPGGWIRWQAGQLQMGQFWSPRPARLVAPRTLQEAREQVAHVLRAAVRQRVEGQPSVLVDLSGGLDSSSCAALAAQEQAPSTVLLGVHFSCHRLPEADERRFAQRVARALGIPLRIWTEEEAPLLQEARWLARLAPVPLTAMLFFGSWYRCLGQLARTQRMRVYLRGTFGDALWDPAWRTILREWWQEHAMGTILRTLWHWHHLGLSWSQVAWTQASALWSPDEPSWRRRPPAPWLRPLVWQRVLQVEEAERQRLRRRGPVQVWEWLRWMDRFAETAALAAARPLGEAGLSSTDPYTDPRVVEQVMAIPLALLVPPGLPPKGFLREVMRGQLPETIRLRATKGRIARAIFCALREQQSWLQDELGTGPAELDPYLDRLCLREQLDRLPFFPGAQPVLFSSLALALWGKQGGATGACLESLRELPAAPVVLRSREPCGICGQSGTGCGRQVLLWRERAPITVS